MIVRSEYEKERRQVFKHVERMALTKKRIRESRLRWLLQALFYLREFFGVDSSPSTATQYLAQ